MENYCVAFADPDSVPYLHEVTFALTNVLQMINRWADNGRRIVFGWSPGRDLQPTDIVYETEQLARPLWSFPPDRTIWTFSDYIADSLRRRGAKQVVMCPIGSEISMIRHYMSARAEPKDIDVLFYGTMNKRRRAIIADLMSTKLTVVDKNTPVFGLERDKLIARSKIVLNMHFYEPAVFEIFRVAHLLSNQVAVVSESGGLDPVLENLALLSTALVPREQLASECVRLVNDNEARIALAQRGFETFRRTDFIKNVRAAIAETESAG